MVWLDTPLALSEDLQLALSEENAECMTYKELHAVLEHTAQIWTSKNISVKRIYLFFGYDDELDLGDGMTCVDYRFRLMKLPSGIWQAVNISAWSEDSSSSGRALFGSFYRPVDRLPGILPDDLDHFPDI